VVQPHLAAVIGRRRMRPHTELQIPGATPHCRGTIVGTPIVRL
jgi:hypothetical protein